MSSFPVANNLCPDVIDIDALGDFGVLISVNDMGVEKRVTEEFDSVGLKLKATFNYLTQVQLNTLIHFYWITKGNFDSFDLPIDFFSVAEAGIENRIRNISGENKWRFNGPPRIKSLYANVHQAEVNLISVKGEPSSVLSGGENPPEWTKKVTPSTYTPIIDFQTQGVVIPDIIWRNLKNPPTITLSNNTFILNNEVILTLVYTPTLNLTFQDLPNDSEVPLNLDPPPEIFFEFDDVTYGERGYLENTPEINLLVGEIYIPSEAASSAKEYKNANFNAVAKTIYYVDTSSNTVNISLPVGVDDDWVRIVDYAGSNPNSPSGFGLNTAFLIATGGQNIQGYSTIDLDVENAGVLIGYCTNGWKLLSTI